MAVALITVVSIWIVLSITGVILGLIGVILDSDDLRAIGFMTPIISGLVLVFGAVATTLAMLLIVAISHLTGTPISL